MAASFKVPEAVDPADVDMTDVLVRENGDTKSHVLFSTRRFKIVFKALIVDTLANRKKEMKYCAMLLASLSKNTAMD